MPPPLFLTTLILRNLLKPGRIEKRHQKLRARRMREGRPRSVEYFHDLTNPHACLTAQVLPDLIACYDFKLCPRLTQGPDQGAMVMSVDPELFEPYMRKDAADVAPHYGLEFSDPGEQPAAALLDLGQRILGATRDDTEQFVNLCEPVTRAVWAGDQARLEALAAQHAAITSEQAKSIIAADEKNRRELGYVYGGSFHFEGIWAPFVDRLCYLEEALTADGARRDGMTEAVLPRPEMRGRQSAGASDILVEHFYSVRSPYSHISWQRVQNLVAATGVRYAIKPIRPVMMRNPKTLGMARQQSRYILEDARREADRYQVPMRRFFDIIDQGTINAYALFAWADARGCGPQLLHAFSSAAFDEGLDTRKRSVIRRLIEGIGLRWEDAAPVLEQQRWQHPTESSEKEMSFFGIWGVPAFRVSGGAIESPFVTWGADRIWLVEREIERRIPVAMSAEPA